MLPFSLLIISLASLAFMLAVALRRKISPQANIADSNELIELVNRYRFFQGKNLETFSRLVSANNINGVEQLIREKFAAQKKSHAESLAQQMLQKLRSQFCR